MFQSASGLVIHGGTFTNIGQINRTPGGMGLLMEWVATGAFHDSDELCDAPKCHPQTRMAILEDIMQWVSESELTRDDFILWLFGPAGAGKSAIAKKIAEMAAEKGVLIGSFFFSRTSPIPGRSNKDHLIATLAYQMALSIPETRTHIEDAIERDPAIFKKNLQTQIDSLLIKPFQFISSSQIIPFPKLIIIDGLDECNDRQAQVAILGAISRSFPKHKLPIIFLVISRPEVDLITSFNSDEPLKSIHRRLALDDNYQPDDDIRLFFSDKFEHIRRTHPFRSIIPIPWPTEKSLKVLVTKSSGQFVYAATVVRFVESKHHRPTDRLNIILGISPPGPLNPFAELDALYNHILSSVDNIQLTLRVLSLYAVAPNFANLLRFSPPFMSPEHFLSLEQGDVCIALSGLSSIVLHDESSGGIKISHTSLVDFLCDPRRSSNFYIDMASTCTDFFRRTLQCIKVPDGIRGASPLWVQLDPLQTSHNSAGDSILFVALLFLFRYIPIGQLRNDILNFNFDAFIKAVGNTPRGIGIVAIFHRWIEIIEFSLEYRDKKEALDRCYNSFESRLKLYQSDRRLQLLLTLAVADLKHRSKDSILFELFHGTPQCRHLDILLEMDDHDRRLLGQDAFDLRNHINDIALCFSSIELVDILSRYVDGDMYASAALHCMHFLSNPPLVSESGVVHAGWETTCSMTLNMLRNTLQEAHTSVELVQFISTHNVHTAVRKHFYIDDNIWSLDIHILVFLSRASVCVNWRIISAIQRALGRTDRPLWRMT